MRGHPEFDNNDADVRPSTTTSAPPSPPAAEKPYKTSGVLDTARLGDELAAVRTEIRRIEDVLVLHAIDRASGVMEAYAMVEKLVTLLEIGDEVDGFSKTPIHRLSASSQFKRCVEEIEKLKRPAKLSALPRARFDALTNLWRNYGEACRLYNEGAGEEGDRDRGQDVRDLECDLAGAFKELLDAAEVT